MFNPGAPPEVNLDDLHTIENEVAVAEHTFCRYAWRSLFLWQVVTFLQSTPCVEQDEAAVKAFMEALRQFDLTKGEKLMLLNLRPKSIAELNPV